MGSDRTDAGRLRGQRSRILILALVAALLAGGAGAVWYVRSSSGAGSQRSTTWAAPASGAEIDAVMQLLGKQAAALTSRDEAGWDAGLDTDPAAATFTDRERAVFDNLGDVPLTVWRYRLVAPVTTADVLGPAATRLRGRVVVLHVQLAYALARVDPAPTEKDLWLTAVLRHGAFLLASDSDVDGAGGQSWHGPWDFGPVVVRSGPHTLVLAHPDHRTLLATYASLVEAAVPVVTSVWGDRWHSEVAVLIPSSGAEFAAVTADQGDTADLAAVSVADAVQPDGTVLGARIVLNPANLGRLDAQGRRLVVQHELTHIAARAVTNDRMPTWVIEGFADYVGNLGSGMSVAASAHELATEVRAGTVPDSLPADGDFAGNNARLSQVYEESWLACRLIAARSGRAGLVRFYRVVSAAAAIDPQTAVAVGLRRVLATSVSSFTASWRAELRRDLAG